MPAASARRWHHPSPAAPRSARAAWSSGVSTPGKNRPLGGISTSTLTHGTPSGTQPVVSQRGSAIPAGMSLWAVQYGFTGYIADQETGLYYARSRLFSSSVGRFLSRDMIHSKNNPSPTPGDGYQDGMSLYRAYFAPLGLDPLGTINCWAITFFRELTGNTYGSAIRNGFQARFNPACAPCCPTSDIAMIQTISYSGSPPHVDNVGTNPAPGSLPTNYLAVGRRGNAPLSYRDAPQVAFVSVFNVEVCASCRQGGSDSILSCVSFTFDQRSNALSVAGGTEHPNRPGTTLSPGTRWPGPHYDDASPTSMPELGPPEPPASQAELGPPLQ